MAATQTDAGMDGIHRFPVKAPRKASNTPAPCLRAESM